MNERIALNGHRLVWTFINILILLSPIIIEWFRPKVFMVKSENESFTYYPLLNESSFTMSYTFNRNISDGEIKIRLYDKDNNVLGTVTDELFVYRDKYVNGRYLTISGEASTYEIISYNCTPVRFRMSLFLLVFTIPIFIGVLTFRYSEYKYYDMLISVYAGASHHTLRINGIAYDEYTTFIFFTPIKLSTTLDDGTKIEATISLTNRITLKINNKLYKQK